jgi:hypothetical protein
MRHTVNPPCQASVCKFTSCSASWVDFNNNQADGCERHCGLSGEICCPTGTACAVGSCVVATNTCP